eukprot:2879274-Rhodomonas_salina.2
MNKADHLQGVINNRSSSSRCFEQQAWSDLKLLEFDGSERVELRGLSPQSHPGARAQHSATFANVSQRIMMSVTRVAEGKTQGHCAIAQKKS